MTFSTFGNRLRQAMDSFGPLCVGIDPHPNLLQQWGLEDDLAGLTTFSLTVVEAVAGNVAAVKPQSALFERHGSGGIAVLERVLAELRSTETLSIADVKRGDIGSTMAGYAQAYCLPSSSLAADALTVSPYLGFESLRPAMDLAAEHGRGVFVLGLTSNPEGGQVQQATGAQGHSVAREICEAVGAENASAGPDHLDHLDHLGSVGLVVGATIGDLPARLGIDLAATKAPLLAPGIGAQGATAADLATTFGAAVRNVLASSSREVLAAGPAVPSLRDAARRSAHECAAALGY